MVEVFTANLIICNSENKVLLVKRASSDSESGKWSIPGGTIEKNESIIRALHREIKEELNCSIKTHTFLVLKKQFSDQKRVSSYYYVGTITGEIKLNPIELSEYNWFSIPEISQLELAFNQNSLFSKFELEIININNV